MFKSKDLREERFKIRNQIQELRKQAGDKPFNAEQREQFDKLDVEQKRLLDEAEGFERIERADSFLSESSENRVANDYKPVSVWGHNKNEGNDAVKGWLLRHGDNNCRSLAQNHEASMKRFGVGGDSIMISRSDDPNLAFTTNAGAEFVPTILADRIHSIQTAYMNVAALADVTTVGQGETNIDLPLDNDSSNEGVFITEADADASAKIPTDKKSVVLKTMTSKIVLITYEMARSSKFPALTWAGDKIGNRLARGYNKKLTLGTGSGGENQGYVPAATLGKTIASSAGPTYAETLDFIYALSINYRQSPSFAMVGSDSFAKSLRALVDGASRPIWEPSLQAGQPDRYLGVRLYVNPVMAATGAINRKIAVAGDFNVFKVFTTGNVELQVARERWIENRFIGLVGFMFFDSVCVDTSGLKYMITPAS